MSRKMTIIGQTVALVFVLGGSTFAWPVPDTGQTKCYNTSGGEIPCPQPGEDLYGQDANYTINPPSYTKLDSTGDVLQDDATTWVMVRDNVTGLIWEAKQNKDGNPDYFNPHDADNTYTWYDPNPATNGGDAGTPGDGTDTDDFIAALNNASFGGFSDWRLPTRKELRSIVDYGKQNPSINTLYFPNAVASYYWSSNTRAYFSKDYAWGMGFYNGSDGSHHSKANPFHVRAVRGGHTQNQFVDNGDGTITASDTGLMWQKETAPGFYQWEQATAYCENLILGGYSDWRLPTIKELDSIGDLTRYNRAIDKTYFPNTMSSPPYLSSTAYYAPRYLWGMYFENCEDRIIGRTSYYYVRAVRGGQNRLLGHLILLSPAQAGLYEGGSNLTITWETAGIEGDVRISLSRDGGTTFNTIAVKTSNDGSYDWTVPAPASVNCVLKIEPLSDASKAAVQGFFTIHQQ